MDPRAWIVAVVFGLVTGVVLGRSSEDRLAVLGTLALTFLIGVATWVGARNSIAGPSLTVGSGVALAAALLAPRAR